MDFGIIQKLAKFIVRPPRAHYSLSDLGPNSFELRNRLYERVDFTIVNNRGLELKCSFLKDKYAPSARATIIFLHANSSSRMIIKNYIDIFLPYYDLLAFDSSGSGLSEGDYITLGHCEKEDLYSLITKAKQMFELTHIILWGRSMGAATALLYAAKYSGIKAIISDNSFSDFEVLASELANHHLPILPQFIIDSIIDSIQEFIQTNIWTQSHTDLNIKKLKPIQTVANISCPIFYIGSIDDQLVNISHTKKLYQLTKSQKVLELVKGNHNDFRSDELKEKVLKFLLNVGNMEWRGRESVKGRSSIFNRARQKIKSMSNLSEKIEVSNWSSLPKQCYEYSSPLDEKLYNKYRHKHLSAQEQLKNIALDSSIHENLFFNIFQNIELQNQEAEEKYLQQSHGNSTNSEMINNEISVQKLRQKMCLPARTIRNGRKKIFSSCRE